MDCMQWSVPPLPQLVTIGHAVWTPSRQHFRRGFGLYDVLFVREGCLYMMEEEEEYAVGPGHILILEPGKIHEGYRQCKENTEIIWMHIKHDSELSMVSSDDIPWSMVLRRGTDKDAMPNDQPIYLPKFGCYELDEVWALLEEMVRLHESLIVGSAMQLQANFVQVLALMQGLIRHREAESSARRLATSVASYLRKHTDEGSMPAPLEEEFHFNKDYITRCLKRHTGMSPLEYIRHIRIEKACRLMRHSPELSIKQIGSLVGIEDVNYFTRTFRREKGMTPAVYRDHRKGFA